MELVPSPEDHHHLITRMLKRLTCTMVRRKLEWSPSVSGVNTQVALLDVAEEVKTMKLMRPVLLVLDLSSKKDSMHLKVVIPSQWQVQVNLEEMTEMQQTKRRKRVNVQNARYLHLQVLVSSLTISLRYRGNPRPPEAKEGSAHQKEIGTRPHMSLKIKKKILLSGDLELKKRLQRKNLNAKSPWIRPRKSLSRTVERKLSWVT